jgi:hypothetical protein
MGLAGRLGLLVVALLAAAALPAACSGDGAPGEERFQQAHEAMGQVVAALEQGDLNGAYVAFQEPHDFTHEIDAPLREKDPDLGQRLYDAVLVMESYDSTDAELLAAAKDIRRYLVEAAGAFGYDIAG